MRIQFAFDGHALGLTLVATEKLLPDQIESLRAGGMNLDVRLTRNDCVALLGDKAAVGECVLVMRLQAIEQTPAVEIKDENERSEER